MGRLFDSGRLLESREYVRFGGGHVVLGEGFVDVGDIHVSVVHDRGLEMSSWHLALYKDQPLCNSWNLFFVIELL